VIWFFIKPLILLRVFYMPRQSKSHALVSDAALGSLNQLGARLKQARLRRNWTQSQSAQKAGLSESSIKKVEAGSSRITMGAYLALLDIYGLATAFDQVLAPGDDTLGEALSRANTRRRARQPRAEGPAEADDWEI
jgi:transcriptional regulator with XRE-family HTH domain